MAVTVANMFARVQRYYQKYRVPIWTLIIFLCIGIIVCAIRDWRYLCLFGGIGITEFIARSIVIRWPKTRQVVRRTIQALIGGMLLIMLGLIYGVNFQFEQIFFDMQAGIVTGALIQLIIARLIIPFVFGNAFCSRACWDGAIFEIINPRKACKKPMQRKEWLAWLYMFLLIALTVLVSWQFTNPADPTYNNENILLRKNWIVAQNLFIITIGFALSFVGGSRFYCRMLCPFMTISSLLYRLSWFKITPVEADRCTQCGKCNQVCPMLSDVRGAVKQRTKVQNAQCILCERCVSACPNNVLAVSHQKAK